MYCWRTLPLRGFSGLKQLFPFPARLFAAVLMTALVVLSCAGGGQDVAGQPFVRTGIHPVQTAAQHGYCPPGRCQRAAMRRRIDAVREPADDCQATGSQVTSQAVSKVAARAGRPAAAHDRHSRFPQHVRCATQVQPAGRVGNGCQPLWQRGSIETFHGTKFVARFERCVGTSGHMLASVGAIGPCGPKPIGQVRPQPLKSWSRAAPWPE